MHRRKHPVQQSGATQRLDAALGLLKPRLAKAEATGVPIQERFLRFAHESRDDLTGLTAKGADPNVVLHILYTHMLEPDEAKRRDHRERERRKLGSAKYWGRIRRALESSQAGLEAFLSTATYLIWSEFYRSDRRRRPFDKICRRMETAAKTISEARDVIAELKLDEGFGEVQTDFDGPGLVPAQKTGKHKSGRAKSHEWGELAFELTEYFRAVTGGPRLAHVCRLLGQVGFRDFTGGGDTQKDMLSKRLCRLRKDPAMRHTVAARLSDCGVSTELRGGPAGDAEIKTVMGRLRIKGKK